MYLEWFQRLVGCHLPDSIPKGWNTSQRQKGMMWAYCFFISWFFCFVSWLLGKCTTVQLLSHPALQFKEKSWLIYSKTVSQPVSNSCLLHQTTMRKNIILSSSACWLPGQIAFQSKWNSWGKKRRRIVPSEDTRCFCLLSIISTLGRWSPALQDCQGPRARSEDFHASLLRRENLLTPLLLHCVPMSTRLYLFTW